MALPRCPTSVGSPRRFPARRPATTRWPNSSAASASLLSALPEGFSPRRWVDLGCGTGHFSRALKRRFGAAEGLAVDIAEGMLRHARARGGASHFIGGDAEAAVARRQLRPAVLQPGHPVVRRPPGGAGRGAAGPAAGRRAGVQQPVRRYPGRVARQLAGGGRLRPRQSLPRLRRLPATRGRQRPAAADPAPRGPAPAFPRPAQPDPRTQGAGRAQPQPRAARRPDRAPAHPRAGCRLRAFPPARGAARYRVVFGVLRKDS